MHNDECTHNWHTNCECMINEFKNHKCTNDAKKIEYIMLSEMITVQLNSITMANVKMST